MLKFLALATSAHALTLSNAPAALSTDSEETTMAKNGKGVFGCDAPTFARYKIFACGKGGGPQDSPEGDTKPLNDVFFKRLTPDIVSFKKEGNKEQGWQKYWDDSLDSFGFMACHHKLSKFSTTGDSCGYEFAALGGCELTNGVPAGGEGYGCAGIEEESDK